MINCIIIISSALESWQETKIVQIDFSTAFDRVDHQGILHKGKVFDGQEPPRGESTTTELFN